MEYKRNRHIKKIFDCYVYRQKGAKGTVQFLLLKRASGKIYEGQWRMIGGKVETGETYWQAALREIDEEIGIRKLKNFWTVPDINSFYEPNSDRILHAPVFAAELDNGSEIELDDEHTEWKWISAEDADHWIAWPQQVRLLQLTDSLLNKEILSDWIIDHKSMGH